MSHEFMMRNLIPCNQVHVVEALREAGVVFPFRADSPVPDAAGIEAVMGADLNASGLALFAQLDSITDQSETVKGLESLQDLLSMPLQLEAGTLDNPLFIQSADPLDVHIVNDAIGVEVSNEDPIQVETGVVTVVIGSTPVSVQISDLGTLVNQIIQASIASGAFGGPTLTN